MTRSRTIEVTVNGRSCKFDFKDGRLQVGLAAGENNHKIRITIRYTAIFDDPAPIRPENADNPGYGFSATISERGSFCWPAQAGIRNGRAGIDAVGAYTETIDAALGLGVGSPAKRGDCKEFRMPLCEC